MNAVTVTLQEDQRQAVLLALAHLAVERPGWHNYLSEIALVMDNKVDCVPEVFTQFWKIRHDTVRDSLPDAPTSESLNKALAKFDNVEPPEHEEMRGVE